MHTSIDTFPISSLSVGRPRGSRSHIKLNPTAKKSSYSAVDKIAGYSPMKAAYHVLFTDGSLQWIKKDNINPVLTEDYDSKMFADQFNLGRDTSQGYAFLYLRTSAEGPQPEEGRLWSSDTSASIEVQRTELCSLVSSANLSLQRFGTDTGRSAKDMNNLHGLELLVEQIEIFNESDDPDNPRGPVFLYVWNVSRLSRNSKQAIALLDRLSSEGVTVIFKEEGVSYSTAAGRHAVRTALSAAQLHSEGTSELVQKVVQLKKKNGTRRAGNCRTFAPYGKKLAQDGSFVDFPEEMKTIATVLKLYSQAKNATKVARILATKRIKLRCRPITEAMIKSFAQTMSV